MSILCAYGYILYCSYMYMYTDNMYLETLLYNYGACYWGNSNGMDCIMYLSFKRCLFACMSMSVQALNTVTLPHNDVEDISYVSDGRKERTN